MDERDAVPWRATVRESQEKERVEVRKATKRPFAGLS